MPRGGGVSASLGHRRALTATVSASWRAHRASLTPPAWRDQAHRSGRRHRGTCDRANRSSNRLDWAGPYALHEFVWRDDAANAYPHGSRHIDDAPRRDQRPVATRRVGERASPLGDVPPERALESARERLRRRRTRRMRRPDSELVHASGIVVLVVHLRHDDLWHTGA